MAERISLRCAGVPNEVATECTSTKANDNGYRWSYPTLKRNG